MLQPRTKTEARIWWRLSRFVRIALAKMSMGEMGKLEEASGEVSTAWKVPRVWWG